MQVFEIPLAETGYIGGLTKAYINHDVRLKPFFEIPFGIENIEKAIEQRKNKKIDRNVLFEVMHAQHVDYYQQFPSLEHSVNLLKNTNTFTITTGHQICLASGPLYFIYKIAAAINICSKLQKQYPGYNFVPVYWMATEDHDFEEINHVYLYHQKISWNSSQQGPTGRISTDGINAFMEELRKVLQISSNDNELFNILENAYLKYPNLSEATRNMVLNIFKDYPILVIDADDARLKSCFKEIIHKDITQQTSYNSVNKSITELVDSGLIKEDKIQVKPREINFFYIEKDSRNRIVKEDNKYVVLNSTTSFTEEQLFNRIDKHTEEFSPNVIMRPLYQECILPNLMYIGGAGEMGYWFELKNLFDAFDIPFPILALRKSFLFVDQKQLNRLKQAGITVQDIFKPIDELVELVLKAIGEERINFDRQKNEADALFDTLKEIIQNIDKTLNATVDAEKQKLRKSLDLLEQKVLRAQKNKHETIINQIKKIKEQLFPGNGLQERQDNFLWLNQKFGTDIIHSIIQYASIENSTFTVLCPS